MTVDPAPLHRAPSGPAALAERYLHDHWKFYAFQGTLMILVGLLALLAPWAATLASTLFFGWLLVFGGILGTVSAFRARGAPGFWSNLILAVLAVLLGLVIIYDPFAGSVTLTWMMALYFLMSGIINIALAQAVRASTGGFWLLLVSGVINVALAIFLVMGLPGTAVWAIGLFLGVSFISSGVALLLTALGSRNRPTSRAA